MNVTEWLPCNSFSVSSADYKQFCFGILLRVYGGQCMQ